MTLTALTLHKSWEKCVHGSETQWSPVEKVRSALTLTTQGFASPNLGPLSRGKALLLSSWAAVSWKSTHTLLWIHFGFTTRKSPKKSIASSAQDHCVTGIQWLCRGRLRDCSVRLHAVWWPQL